MDTRAAVAAVLLLALAPAVAAQDEPDTAAGEAGWSTAVLTQTEEVPALVTAVAAGPDRIVAVGGFACERRGDREDDPGRCWGQPWVSTDGHTWDAVEARTSGLDLGVHQYTMHGPEFGLAGIAYGPAGFVAYGWAAPSDRTEAETVILEPTLWRSDDGEAWTRVPSPEGFTSTGLMLTGPWLRAIAGTDEGYLLGGTVYGTPAPRAAIWTSPDGLEWTLAGPDDVFGIGAYIDTMEVPMAGGIAAFALAPTSDGTPATLIAVGSACPRAKAGAGPKARRWKRWEWTTGECRARIWRSDDGMTWEASGLRDAAGKRIEAYAATDVAASVDATVAAVYPTGIIYSRDDATWAASPDGKVHRQRALAASRAGFRALVPKCEVSGCRRRTLAAWSSADGAEWELDRSQPTLPVDADEFIYLDTASFGDRTVVTVSYLPASGDPWPSVALLSPPWPVAADR